MKKNQSGFALIEGLLIILIIAIIGFGGYYVWHTQKQTDKTLDTAAATSQKAASTAAQAPAQKYLTIKEWGVKIPLTAPDQDAYYVIKTDRPDTAYLSLKKYQNTECSADNTSIGAYFRFTKDQTDDLNGSTLISENPDAPRVGNYYFGSVHSQAACSTTSDSAEPSQTDVDALQAPWQALVKDLGRIQAE